MQMPANDITIDHLLDIVKGQARLESKIDSFFDTLDKHDNRVGALEDRVGKAEDDIADLRAQRSSDFRVIGVLGFVAGGIVTALQWAGWTGIKAFLKL